jgi:ABC-2 type transport system ATP-binding protein
MLGLLRPTSGRVTVFGRVPDLGSDLYRSIAYLPEEPHYHDYLTVEEAVRYYVALYGRGVPRAQLEDVLERLGLARFRGLVVRKCSKGMKQKVGIAQCVLSGARLFFLDEPMRGLDPVTVREFRDLLVELNRGGATIVMNSHILAEVEMVANRAAIIDRGRLVVQDELEKLQRADEAVYEVELQDHPDLPDVFVRGPAPDGQARGTVSADRLYELLDFARAQGLVLNRCSLQRPTLEDSFLAILGKQGPDA